MLTRLCYGKSQNRLLILMISTPNLSARNLRKLPGGALSPLEVEAEDDLHVQNQTILMCKCFYLCTFNTTLFDTEVRLEAITR